MDENQETTDHLKGAHTKRHNYSLQRNTWQILQRWLVTFAEICR